MNTDPQKWALFWCGLLHPVIFDEVKGRGTHPFLRSLARSPVLFPDGVLRAPSLSTLQRKLRQFQLGGFHALFRKLRSDRGFMHRPGETQGQIRALLDKIIELKREQPYRSDRVLNDFLLALFGKTIPRSTLYRHLKRAGATRLKLGITQKPVRKRWTKDRTHELWVGDFEDGPCVLVGDEALPTHLSAFIDCHSRFIIEARYYLRENLDILIDSFLRALALHGAPEGLYLDNAKIYHSNALKAASYALHFDLIHSEPGDPPPRGIIEKFFQTAQGQFEIEVRQQEILSLHQLNRAFAAWLEVKYHDFPNSDTGQTPRARYHAGLTLIRHVDLAHVLPFFMEKTERVVHPTFSDVALHGRFYRVDSRLRGDRVLVRFDPFGKKDTVLLYAIGEEEVFLGQGVLHHREKGEKPIPADLPARPQHNYLDLLLRKHEERLSSPSAGIDFREALSRKAFPFLAFLRAFALLLGKKGYSDFSSDQVDALRRIYNRFPDLDEPSLTEAFQTATEKSIPSVAYHLSLLANKKRRGKET